MGLKRASHAVYDTRYHLVWAPKYRKCILRDEVREYTKKVFREIGERYEFEMEVCEEHVHIFLGFPPRYSIGDIVRIIKSTSARKIFRRYPELKEELWGGELWEGGYFVRTVGDKVTKEVIKRYIRYQHDEKGSQLELF
ncbi:MAG: IS200/IS605 family transposase [Candidatus Cloacimonadota bacterium]|nr:MAG: IS200/IS605 family transposase [Candidatus Cloacimonadota bacterium]